MKGKILTDNTIVVHLYTGQQRSNGYQMLCINQMDQSAMLFCRCQARNKVIESFTEPNWRKILCTGAEQMSPYPWKWKISIRVGGSGQEGHQSTTANSVEKITQSSARYNETAALAITDGSCLMAMIFFFPCTKEKKIPFYSRQNKGCLLQPAIKGVSF